MGDRAILLSGPQTATQISNCSLDHELEGTRATCAPQSPDGTEVDELKKYRRKNDQETDLTAPGSNSSIHRLELQEAKGRS